MAPIIGINTTLIHEAGQSPLIGVRATYLDSVIRAGGVPVVLPSTEDLTGIAQQVAMCDGFIFVGGPDISPARFGQQEHPTTSRVPARREEYDFALINAVIETGKPFLAICLGCQEVNVALGGDLIQDINSECTTTLQHALKQHPYFTRHDVTIEPGSKLRQLVGKDVITTNSSHHQALRLPAPRVVVTGRARDGIIESFELRDYPFGLGIQWHPESLSGTEAEHLRLFEGLIEAAAATH
jgi:putative glutamine amidotransferase